MYITSDDGGIVGTGKIYFEIEPGRAAPITGSR